MCIREIILRLDYLLHYWCSIISRSIIVLFSSCFVLWWSTKDISKDLNIFVWFSCEVTPLVFKNSLRSFLDSKSEKFKHIEALQGIKYSYKWNYGIYSLYTPLPKVWKQLGGQDGRANVNKIFCQKYNNEFLCALLSNRCEISHKYKKY